MKVTYGVMCFALFSLASVAEGQQEAQQAGSPAPRVDCQHDLTTPGKWSACALALTHTGLRRASTHELLSEVGLVSPIRLLDFVTGDSAVAFARSYQRRFRFASVLEIIGGAAIGSGVFPRRGTSPDAAHARVKTGVTFVAAGVPFLLWARHAGTRAVSSYNASLAR